MSLAPIDRVQGLSTKDRFFVECHEQGSVYRRFGAPFSDVLHKQLRGCTGPYRNTAPSCQTH